MKREILIFKPKNEVGNCCPGHDPYPDDTYKGRLSKRARARDKKKEHQFARTLAKRAQQNELEEEVND